MAKTTRRWKDAIGYFPIGVFVGQPISKPKTGPSKTAPESRSDASRPDDAQKDIQSPEVVALVQLCAAGDAASLEQFFTRFASDIYNFPLKVFHLDEDAASDFFLYAYERLRDGARFRSFQGRSSFRTWFYAVLRNLVIDWMRTIREVETVNRSYPDHEGSEYRSIENTPDPRSLRDEDAGIRAAFETRLLSLTMEMRLVFKLCFLYYLDLDDEELKALSERTGKTPASIMKSVADLKHRLSAKEITNLEAEDKITSLYLSIVHLKERRQNLINRPGNSGPRPPTDFEVIRLDKAIEKKYKQRDRLLERKERGHFVVRTPYKFVADLLQMPEGSISVHMMRALEKMRIPRDVKK
ncbi:MAG: sigma-70 family RNA polymerase sigma factor [Spirochaetia bacterium]|nr:sigma-70 family RNA polymerase sigma factor [Spirochaetia bacterium]